MRTVQVRIQSSGMSLKTHNSVSTGLPYLVAEQSACFTLLCIETDEMACNDILKVKGSNLNPLNFIHNKYEVHANVLKELYVTCMNACMCVCVCAHMQLCKIH